MASSDSQEAIRNPGQPRCVHTITDRFSMANTYLINDERLIVVDPGSELNIRQLAFYLKRILHRSLADIDLIVFTHLHSDHTAGVETLRHLCNAPIAASAVIRKLVAKRRQNRQLTPSLNLWGKKLLPGFLQHLDLSLPAYERQMKYIDIWLDDVAGLPGHPNWRVIASPGHTPESICLYNPFTYELLCGDTVITLRGAAPLVRGSMNRQQQMETLRLLQSLRIHYLYPGHGRAILGIHPLQNADVEY